MDTIDFKKKYHELYSAPAGKVGEVVVPKFIFAMVDGEGAQGGPEASPEFQNAIGALYSITFTLKFARKKAGLGPDYTISPLEGLWWMADGQPFDIARTGQWRWTLMIMQPDFIDPAEFAQTLGELKLSKPNPALAKLRLEAFEEGPSVQIMHVGPYSAEAENIQKMEDYCAAHGYALRGRHHEIYLGDPRRARPDKLRTLLRHPFSVNA